jgi:hypothetical protein
MDSGSAGVTGARGQHQPPVVSGEPEDLRAVRGPLEALLEEVRDEFGDAKVFRPNRDTRFSADRAPTKKEIYAVLFHPARGGWYVHLNKEGLFTGGVYAPDRPRLAALRSAIAADDTGSKLEVIIAQMEAEGLELMTEGALKTAPTRLSGRPPTHPPAPPSPSGGGHRSGCRAVASHPAGQRKGSRGVALGHTFAGVAEVSAGRQIFQPAHKMDKTLAVGRRLDDPRLTTEKEN